MPKATHLYWVLSWTFGLKTASFRTILRGASAMLSLPDSSHLTLHERERLFEARVPRRTGFTSRPIERLATRKPRATSLHAECQRIQRCDSATSQRQPLSYRMWLEAGKHDPPFPDPTDAQYNSNVWRNFRKEYGFRSAAHAPRITETIAIMYPMSLPPPSHVGPYTYPQFLRDTSAIKDSKIHKLVLEKSVKELEQFKRLRLLSDMRNPPLDKDGNIMPPLNFKRHVTRFVAPTLDDDSPTDRQTARAAPLGAQLNMFPASGAHRTPPPHLWKLCYRLNNPEYEKVQEEIEMNRKLRQSV